MKKALAGLLVVTMLGGLTGGCANIQNDSTRTKTEAVMVGSAGGAAVGAGVGAAVGGGRGALVGAGLGALVGGIAGFFVGVHISEQKEKYASEEAWLDACLNQAKETTDTTKMYNAELTAQIATVDKETKALKAAYTKKQVDQRTMALEWKKLHDIKTNTDKMISFTNQEINGQGKAAAEAKKSGRTKEAALLDAEIATLQRQKAQLEKSNKQLASMSSRISL